MAEFTSALAATGERVVLRPDSDGVLAIHRLGDDRRVGSVEVRAGAAPDELIVWSLCIGREHRGYGCGSEAVLLLVRAALGTGFCTVWSRAHPDFGLSVYFWIRMGFRPLHGEGPEGGIWLVRRLAS